MSFIQESTNTTPPLSPLLTLDRVSFSIGSAQILSGISLQVSAGETIGIIGPNGSGKTTLFNCLSGFHRLQSGTIHFGREDITSCGPAYRARQGIGRVFQNSGIFREMTVLENLITAIEGRYSLWKTWLPWGALPRAIREESYALLKEVGLEGKALERAASLSGGQMRLLEIVRALGFGAELFLLDEPTAGVSPSMKDEVARVIEKLRETKKTILVIEHDIQFIQRFCERIIVLDSGSVVMDGAPQEVRESERLQQIYFGSHAPSA